MPTLASSAIALAGRPVIHGHVSRMHKPLKSSSYSSQRRSLRRISITHSRSLSLSLSTIRPSGLNFQSFLPSSLPFTFIYLGDLSLYSLERKLFPLLTHSLAAMPWPSLSRACAWRERRVVEFERFRSNKVISSQCQSVKCAGNTTTVSAHAHTCRAVRSRTPPAWLRPLLLSWTRSCKKISSAARIAKDYGEMNQPTWSWSSALFRRRRRHQTSVLPTSY